MIILYFSPCCHFRRDKRLLDTSETRSSLCPATANWDVFLFISAKNFEPNWWLHRTIWCPASSSSVIELNREEREREEKKSESLYNFTCCCCCCWPTFFIHRSISSWKFSGWEASQIRELCVYSPGRKTGRELGMWKRKFRFCCLIRDHMVSLVSSSLILFFFFQTKKISLSQKLSAVFLKKKMVKLPLIFG